MQVWVATQNHEISQGIEVVPTQVVASLNNNPGLKTSELYVKEYLLSNKPGSHIKLGTDHLYSIYEDSKSEHMDYLIQDGDVEKDIFVNYEYLGEVYGEYNYLLSSKKRDSFLQKIKSNETIEVSLTTPLLGLMRGNRVNFLWYVNDSSIESMHENLNSNGATEEAQTNIPLDAGSEIEPLSQNGEFILDKSISGQYLITECVIKYVGNEWIYKLTLSRPTSARPKIINENE